MREGREGLTGKGGGEGKERGLGGTNTSGCPTKSLRNLKQFFTYYKYKVIIL